MLHHNQEFSKKEGETVPQNHVNICYLRFKSHVSLMKKNTLPVKNYCLHFRWTKTYIKASLSFLLMIL